MAVSIKGKGKYVARKRRQLRLRKKILNTELRLKEQAKLKKAKE